MKQSQFSFSKKKSCLLFNKFVTNIFERLYIIGCLQYNPALDKGYIPNNQLYTAFCLGTWVIFPNNCLYRAIISGRGQNMQK
jgi:hypothetical protein